MTYKELPKTDYGNLLNYFPFDEFRGDQERILIQMREWLLDPNVDVIVCQAATGIGKSALAMALAKASRSAYVATANKALQDQYVRDFADLLENLKGRANYQCTRYTAPPGRSPYNCGDSPCRETKESRSQCGKESCCQYHIQRSLTAKADVASFNFASALPFLNYLSHMFQPRNLLICDEAHSVWQWLTGFVGIDLTSKALREVGILESIPNYVDIEMYVGLIEKLELSVDTMLELDFADDPEAGKTYEKLETLKNKLLLFNKVTDNKTKLENFVIDKKYDPENPHVIHTIAFKPVDVSSLLQEFFFRHAEKTVLLSAVILDFDTYFKVMGIDPNRAKVMVLDSPFPVENRPINTYEAVGRLSKKNLKTYLPDLCYKVVKLMNIYREVKGIIHGVSWDLCRKVYEGVNDEARGRLLLASKPSEQRALLQEHEESDDPTVLLSPSMMEGVDLKDDLSRLQIILKVPYPYLGDPVVVQRMKLFENYYGMMTAQALVQMYGRSIRSEEDWADTYVLDSNFLNFINFNGWLLPPSFHKALVRRDFS